MVLYDCPLCRYGYDYPCRVNAAGQPMGPEDDLCPLAEVPFQGAPCSDAAGSQKDYREIMQGEEEWRPVRCLRLVDQRSD